MIKKLRDPSWLGHIYLNLAWACNQECFAFVAEQYFAKSRGWANAEI